ncbi:hypothetical protein [Ruegeria atlantica]|uniref:phage tail tube protein n=1 Tax=Ruegeria atlantica TaxID=81569 RepID=UPI00147B222B|nr:hypothetical protein [Ruegeria atlantica]
MTLQRSTHVNNVVVGSGELYLIEPEGGERYLGDSDSASVTVSTEYITVESGDGPVAQRLVHKPRSVTRRMDLALRDITADNLALYILGDRSAVAAATAQAQDEVIDNVRTDVWYQLGVSVARPEGVWGISTEGLTVKTKTAANNARPTALNNTQGKDDKFTVDAEAGRIRFNALLENVKQALVSYTAAAPALTRAASTEARVREFGLRYIEDATVGVGKRIFVPRCTVGPNGQLALKSRTSEQQLPLQVDILKPATGEALVIYGPEPDQE